jgi:hypothetical protein
VRGAAQRDERRHVDVVPARVHHAAAGGELDARLLLDRQAVELGTDRDRAVRDLGADTREQSRAGDALSGNG